MKTSKFTDEQIALALRQAGAGTPVGEICRERRSASGASTGVVNLVDRRDRHINLMEALEIKAKADRPVLALRADTEDESDDVRRCCEVRLTRSGLEVLQALESVLR